MICYGNRISFRHLDMICDNKKTNKLDKNNLMNCDIQRKSVENKAKHTALIFIPK